VKKRLDRLWANNGKAFRRPERVAAQWHDASQIDPAQLSQKTKGPFWDLLEELEVTLIVTREYEHMVAALSPGGSSFLPLPHPNGLAWDASARLLYVASTRNPNMIYELKSAPGSVTRGRADPRFGGLLLPLRARYLPGSMYIHDLAVVSGRLLANAVAMNAIAELPQEGGYRLVWWPETIDAPSGPRFDKNYLQLNSIAAGRTLKASYFTASAESPSRRRPGHLDFPVDKRGVLFSGKTRAVVARGLTRPHSARLHQGRVFIDNSGYGELVVVDRGEVEVVARLPGWTRGLCFVGGIAFVATSRILARFEHYAPGLDPKTSICAVHAIEVESGRVLARLEWPVGNQLFAIEALPSSETRGFPMRRAEDASSTFLHDVFFRAHAHDPT
jgi:uncharacterized protein (TIGR03032 family)